jgi:alpha/beta superfamily hydrolase
MEERVFFTSDNLRIEGMLEIASPARGAVITHPHPLYGGDMDNPVVMAVQRAYRRQGISTLRFNFRGVGASEGAFDDGAGERRDVCAALAFLSDRGVTAVDLAGYSFGAWVNAGAGGGFQRMVMVSPPVAFIRFDPVAPIPTLQLIVTGGRDEIAPPGMISTCRDQWNPAAAFEVLPDADHFYTGHLRALEDRIASCVQTDPVRDVG